MLTVPALQELAHQALGSLGVSADLVGKGSAKFLRPQPDGLVRDDDPAGSQQVLDHTQGSEGNGNRATRREQ